MLSRLSVTTTHQLTRSLTPRVLSSASSSSLIVLRNATFSQVTRRNFSSHGDGHHDHAEVPEPDFRSAWSVGSTYWLAGMVGVGLTIATLAYAGMKEVLAERDTFRLTLAALTNDHRLMSALGTPLQIVGQPLERFKGDRIYYKFQLQGPKNSATVNAVFAYKNRQFVCTYLAFQAKEEAVTYLEDFDNDLIKEVISLPPSQSPTPSS